MPIWMQAGLWGLFTGGAMVVGAAIGLAAWVFAAWRKGGNRPRPRDSPAHRIRVARGRSLAYCALLGTWSLLACEVSMLTGIPSEVQILGVYFPPLFVAILGGLFCAMVMAKLLNLSGLSRFFWHPPLAYSALWLLATSLIGLLIIAP